MNVFRILLGIFIGAFFGALIEGVEGYPKMITAGVFGGLAVVFGLIIGIQWRCNKIWPGRDKWWATSSMDGWVVSPQNNPQNALSDNRGQIWRSPLVQELRAWFEAD